MEIVNQENQELAQFQNCYEEALRAVREVVRNAQHSPAAIEGDTKVGPHRAEQGACDLLPKTDTSSEEIAKETHSLPETLNEEIKMMMEIAVLLDTNHKPSEA